jgi:general L-amino acid transport system substrate-binding protein
MTKKRLLLMAITMLLSFVLLAACGGSGGDTADLEAQVSDLQAQLEAAQAEAADAVAAAANAGSGEAEQITFAGGGDTLKTVQDRGTLKCGGNATLAGFGFLDPATNEFTGFDIDFCKAIAAAVLGNAEAVEVTATTGTSRFPTLQSGEVDVLIRNTTWTISRDTSLGGDFAPTTFYDGQGMMVLASSGITNLEDLEGGSVCVQAGTTTEKNLADVYRALDVEIESQVYPDNPSTTAAYTQGLCDGITTDKSGLVSIRSTFDNPDDHVILDATMSKEPLAPMVRHGDNNWGDIVMWVTNCTIQAEESGVTSANVDDMLGSDDPGIQNLLGVSGELGAAMGLDADFCYQVIKQVGNYGEIYDRHLTPLGLGRGLNAQWTDGGLLYAPPFR